MGTSEIFEIFEQACEIERENRRLTDLERRLLVFVNELLGELKTIAGQRGELLARLDAIQNTSPERE